MDHKETFAQMHARWTAERAEEWRKVRSAAGWTGPARLTHQDGTTALLTPQNDGQGWRITRMDDRGPWTHSEHRTRLIALACYCGFWIRGYGCPYSHGPWTKIEPMAPRKVYKHRRQAIAA